MWLVVGYCLLASCWLFTVPPFSAPDEADHFQRAISVGAGQIIGARPEKFSDPALEPRQEAWVAQTVRRVNLRDGLVPDGYACNAFKPALSAHCDDLVPPVSHDPVTRLTMNGTYQPAPFLLPGLFADATRDRLVALRLARIASAITSLLLLVTAVLCFVIDDASSLGVLVAVTPMVVFIGSVLNPSGPEVAAGVALIASLLALGRERNGLSADDIHKRLLALALVAGVALALTRTLGPLWIALEVGLWVFWIGWRRALELTRRAPRWSAATVGAIAVACAVNRLWEGRYGPHLAIARTESLATAIDQSVRLWPRWILEHIGDFQYLDTPMPRVAVLAWGVVAVGLVALALIVGTPRDRRALLLVGGTVAVVPVMLHAVFLRPIGWAIQGRHVLPLTVALPLFAGEILSRNRPRFASTASLRLLSAAGTVCALVQLAGLYANGRRSAVGVNGPGWFMMHAEWSPTLGWATWCLVGAAGASALTLGALTLRGEVRD